MVLPFSSVDLERRVSSEEQVERVRDARRRKSLEHRQIQGSLSNVKGSPVPENQSTGCQTKTVSLVL